MQVIIKTQNQEKCRISCLLLLPTEVNSLL